MTLAFLFVVVYTCSTTIAVGRVKIENQGAGASGL